MKKDELKTSDEFYLSKKCAWLYFVGNLNQNQISKQIGISKMRVHRLIAFAEKKVLLKLLSRGFQRNS